MRTFFSKKRVFLFLTVLLIALVGTGSLWAGGQAEDEEEAEATTEEKEPTEVVLAMSGNPDTLDPHVTSGTLTFQTINSFYDNLIEPDKDGELVPALAEDYEVSDDYETYTFYLRKGVTFQDGTPFTSADVKATYERILDSDLGSPHENEFDVISEIETPDDHTVILHLSKPYSPLLGSIASGWGAILPKHLIDDGHDFDAEPVGTGPFVFTEWVRDNQISMEKNEDYWMEGVPKVDNVVLQIIPEQSVQLQGLLSGQVDITYLIEETDIPRIENSNSVTLNRGMSSLAMIIAINCSREYLDNVKLRQAMNMAIDRQEALDIAYSGGRPIYTFMDYDDPYYVDLSEKYPYDPDKAREMIEELDIPEDETFTMYLPQNYPPHVKAGELYQEMLEEVGLNIELRMIDWSTWISDVYSDGQYDLTVIGHTGKLDPDGRLANYGQADETYVQWENEEVADLIEKARRVADFDERKELYTEALTIMSEEAPFVFVGTSFRYIAHQKDVTGFYLTPKLDEFEFRYVEKK
ncbi:MAG: ABC transporter substrate-binding protein [Spirochaetaceae bacterium]